MQRTNFEYGSPYLTIHYIIILALAYEAAGIQCPIGVRAHSTRGMASSWAWSSGISIGEICAAAGWSSPSTFVRFYNLNVPAMQACILSV